MARASLEKTLKANFSEIKIVGSAGSIKDSVSWINANPSGADVIFMDVELSDGKCFEIFRQADVHAKIIMTTAYDSYAIKAFEVNSIDYLLKPIDTDALKRAISRCSDTEREADAKKISGAFLPRERQEYKQRYIIRLNDKIVPVKVSDIAYFYSEYKTTILSLFNGTQHIIDYSLELLAEELDPRMFFRISRSCIINIQTIESVVRQSGSRLKIIPSPGSDFEMTVSRSRVDDFLSWLEGRTA